MRMDVFNVVLERVCLVMELPAEGVLRRNDAECVDGRYVVIAVLSERYSDKQIAAVSGWSVQLVNKARNCFHERCRWRWGLKEVFKGVKEMC